MVSQWISLALEGFTVFNAQVSPGIQLMATMASANYNEVSHTKRVDYSVLDPMYKWDVHFPDHISRLTINEDFHHNRSSSQKRRGGRGRARNTNRYKTQPITFDEIKEVDEEKGTEKLDGTDEKEKDGLKSQFTAFSRSMDGLMPGYPRIKNPPMKPSPLVTGMPTIGPTPPQSPLQDGNISLSIRVPDHFSTSSSQKSPTTTSAETEEKTGANLNSCSPEKPSRDVTSPSPSTQVTSQELSAIGLKALPDLPEDASRARRAKRRQKKLIEEEPETDTAKNSKETG